MCEGYIQRFSASWLQHDAKNETQPQLARRRGKLEGLPDTPKYVALDDTAGIAFVDSRAQRDEFRFALLFLALQIPQPGSHNFTGVFVTSCHNLFGDEAVKFVGQVDISSRHGGCPFHGCELRNDDSTIGKDCQSTF